MLIRHLCKLSVTELAYTVGKMLGHVNVASTADGGGKSRCGEAERLLVTTGLGLGVCPSGWMLGPSCFPLIFFAAPTDLLFRKVDPAKLVAIRVTKIG